MKNLSGSSLFQFFLLAAILASPAIVLAGAPNFLAPNPVALVYNGPGACEEHCADAAADVARAAGLEVRFVNDTNWSEEQFRDAVVWVQPGGHSAEVAAALQPSQKARLRQFVASGGGYTGFCAGGFFASEHYTGSAASDKPVELLGLIPADADLFMKTDAAMIVAIDWLGTQRQFYWEGGPIFLVNASSQTGQTLEIVAKYDNGQNAAVRTTYGAGRVFVSGFHPEAPADWRNYFHLVDPDGLDTEFATNMIRWAMHVNEH